MIIIYSEEKDNFFSQQNSTCSWNSNVALFCQISYNHFMIRFEDTEAQSAFEAELESLMTEEPDMDSQERIELAFEITKLAFETE